MCGVGGVVGLDIDIAMPAAERMRAALRHRGPDDEGLAIVHTSSAQPAVLVHTRLSIIELSEAGHQPMWDGPADDGTSNALVFNGEIYNYRELWPELAAQGHQCRTQSDTEVILRAYRAWGPRAVEHLDGMFAFALVDTVRGLVWLCRDRVGIKPFYRCRPEGGGLLFASELRAVLAGAGDRLTRRLRLPALESFLAQGAVHGEKGIVEGVELIAPGCSELYDLDGRLVRQKTYWQVEFGTAEGRRTADVVPQFDQRRVPLRGELVEDLRLALRDSLSRLLVADVPVGLFLSSGIDSAGLAAIATESGVSRIRSISIGFDQLDLDETAGAELVARSLGTEHTTIVLSTREIVEHFDDVLACVDQPTVDGFNTFFVSRAARDAGLTVALSGLGGDELFGGYSSFRDLPKALFTAPLTQRVPIGLARALSLVAGVAPSSRRTAKLIALLGRPSDVASLYLLRRELMLEADRRKLFDLPRGSDAATGVPTEVLEELRAGHVGRDLLDRVAFLEFTSYMRHMLLRDADVFSMANALELRVPLLERPVVEAAARAVGAFRRADPRLKPLFQDAVGAARLPDAVVSGKKRGFTFPWRAWLHTGLRERCRASLLEASTWSSLGLDPKAVGRAWLRFEAGDRSVSELEILALVGLADFCARHGIRA